MTRRRPPALLVTLSLGATLLGATGCGSGAGAAGTVSPEPTSSGAASNARTVARPSPPPSGDGTIPVLAPGEYEVHEWGLMRAGAGDVLEVGAVAPPVVREPLVVDKPILYFHAGSSMQVARVEVHASGDVREHWPLTARGMPRSIVWRGVSLDASRRAGSTACPPGAYPSATEAPCDGLARGELCESSSLGPLAAQATCLRLGAGTHPFLFYRSRTRAFTPPLRLERLPSGEIRATHTGDVAIPGSVVVIRRRGGGTVARSFAPPGPGRSSVLGADASHDDAPADMPVMPSDVASGRAAVRSTMRVLGMTDGEIDAFLRAWDAQLFEGTLHAQNVATDELTVDRRAVTDPPPPADSVLYFLPTETCDGVSRLAFEPAPRAVRRALAVWGAVR